MAKAKQAAGAPARSRDRDATAAAILLAAKQVLAEEGFQAFGLRSIARRAACDKQLIYRYFGGLEELVDAIGADLAAEITQDLQPLCEPAPKTYSELMQRLALGLLDLLRRNRLMQQINAWEAAAPSPLVKRLVDARAKPMMQWMAAMRGELTPPEGVDAPALNALIIAAIQQLVLSGAANGAFSGLPLKTEAQWTRLKEAVLALTAAVYPA